VIWLGGNRNIPQRAPTSLAQNLRREVLRKSNREVRSLHAWAHLDTATGRFSLSPPAERGERGTMAVAATPRDGLLSLALSSKGAEGARVVGWWQCQDSPCTLPILSSGES
jgi:hypothetical protein